MTQEVKIHPSWYEVLKEEFDKEYFEELSEFIKDQIRAGRSIYPHPRNIFAAFDGTPFDKVKVVIVGQDPYHGAWQAHGLSFSVQDGVRTPPSLQNIYKELKEDIGMEIPDHGYLQSWADQGVLLLNSVLTVEAGQPASHAKKGWEEFTDAVIKVLSDKGEGLVFLQWGAYAQKKGLIVDRVKHRVMQAAHPSPFAARKGFFGCKHFSATNKYLESQWKTPINWNSINQ